MRSAFFRLALLCGLVSSLAALVGCEAPLGGSGTTDSEVAARGAPGPRINSVVQSVEGSGHYLLAGTFDVEFSIKAKVHSNGNVNGDFRQRFVADGLLIDVEGKVTFLSFDAVNRRAWIGGVVKKNNSTDPDLQQTIHQPGHDVWFRVVDLGSGSPEADRLTFLGFEGSAGFTTSEEYVAAMPWPADNARTHPVTSGDIAVDP